MIYFACSNLTCSCCGRAASNAHCRTTVPARRRAQRCVAITRCVREVIMRIEGRCHCGYITYEAEIDPEAVGVCHCTDCQSLTGSAFSVFVPASRESFRLLTGQPNIYVKTAESGTKRAQAFCPECGSRIYAAAVTDPQTFNLRMGTVVQRAKLWPKKQVWCRSALPWITNLNSITQIPTQ